MMTILTLERPLRVAGSGWVDNEVMVETNNEVITMRCVARRPHRQLDRRAHGPCGGAIRMHAIASAKIHD